MEIRYSKQCIYLSRVLSDSSNWVAIFAGRQRGRESETDVNNVVVKICIQIQTPSQLELMWVLYLQKIIKFSKLGTRRSWCILSKETNKSHGNQKDNFKSNHIIRGLILISLISTN